MASTGRLSVVIPVLNGAAALPACLGALEPARRGGLVHEIVVVDGGSNDGIQAAAIAGGARLIAAPAGRGAQLAAGATASSGDWLLFLHADTVLAQGWAVATEAFIAEPANRGRAGYFQFRLDDTAWPARLLEHGVALRCRWFGLPYGDQGLLLAADFYRSLGGFRPMPLMEDVDLVRRIGRRNLVGLSPTAMTSAARYRRDGYMARVSRNLTCLGLYYLGLPLHLIRRLYA